MADVIERRASIRDIVEVIEEGHRHFGTRFVVLSATAGIGSQFILGQAEKNELLRTGLRHEHVAVVGRLAPDVTLKL